MQRFKTRYEGNDLVTELVTATTGIKFKGKYIGSKRQGKCQMLGPDGDFFECEFVDDKLHGVCTLTLKDETKF